MDIDVDMETRLRRHFATDRGEPGAAPTGLADRVRRRYRSRRRAQVAALGAALVAVLVPVGVRTIAAPPGHVVAAGGSASSSASLYELRTRGSLAHDATWVSGVAALPWAPPVSALARGNATSSSAPVAAPSTHRVAFAGDVPGGRVALVVAKDADGLAYAWFTGPPNATPAQMELNAPGPGRTSPGEPLALWRAPGSTGHTGVLVLVDLPGGTATFSVTQYLQRLNQGPDITTAPQRLDVVDGIAVAPVPVPAEAVATGTTARLRVTHDGRTVQIDADDVAVFGDPMTPGG